MTIHQTSNEKEARFRFMMNETRSVDFSNFGQINEPDENINFRLFNNIDQSLVASDSFATNLLWTRDLIRMITTVPQLDSSNQNHTWNQKNWFKRGNVKVEFRSNVAYL